MAALMELAVAAGKRLLLQAAAPAAEEAAAAGLAAPAPGPEAASAANSSDSGYQVSFGSSSCANMTGTLPICYNTVISGENLITGFWVNLIIGLVIYLLFVAFRGLKGFEFYHARLLLPAVSRKPPQLHLHGHERLWGWLQPVFRVSDEELVRSAGLDALIGVRIISFGVLLFLPMTILSVAVLLPINYTSDYYKQMAAQEGMDGPMDEYTSAFMRMTISNIPQHSPRLWAHFAFVYLNVFWASWLIIEYYKEYIALRQTYLVRCTTMPGDNRSSGSSATPLLTPSVHASRSPMKRALAVAQPQSPSKRGLTSAGSGTLKPSGSSGSLTSLGRAMNRLKLPRRDASRAGDEFGEFAFRPSRFASPSASPLGGSPGGGAAEVATAGGIFTYSGPSHLAGHSCNPSKGSPAPPEMLAADGTGAAANGLAAALAALPPGSPMRRADSATPPPGRALLGPAGGHMSDAAPRAVAGDTPDASGHSTPASDLGGAGPASRPLLSRILRSSDRQSDSGTSLRQQRRRADKHGCGGSAAEDDSSQAEAGREQTPEQQQQQRQQTPQTQEQTPPQHQRLASSLDYSFTLSLGQGRAGDLGDLGSISLNASSASDEEDTAASPAPRPTGLSAGVNPLYQQQAQRPSSGERSGASTAALLPPLAVESAAGSSPPIPAGPSPLDALAALDALPVAPRHGASSSFDVAAALGYDQKPPNPEDIYAAIVGKSGSAARHSSEGQLPAVYGAAGGPTLPSPSAELSGGEGIATRWWAAQQGVSPNARLLHTNQSITMKGAVRLSRPDGGHSDLAANASLYTCLVMDMPLETLKLRRIGVFQVAWRHLQLESARSLQPASATASGAAAGSAAVQEDITAALDELERGQSGGVSGRYDVDAHAVGLKGVLARLASMWRHRARYAEWRRDVRWAMYNKRVRIATEMFSELFGPDFDAIIPIYPTASVDCLAHKWDARLATLERLQLQLSETPRTRARKVAKLRDRIGGLQREVTQLQSEIAAERDAVLSDLPSTCFFATFRSQQAAAVASQTNLNPITQRLFKVQPAPRPDDVNWPTLQRSWWQRTMRPLYALPIILFFMLLPIGMFTGAFAQLTVALCGSPQDPGTRSGNWYCSDDRWATFVRNTVTSLAPSLVLSIYHMVFLPVMVYYAAQMEGQHTSLSALDRRCANLFFYWDVFNIFLGALFGGTVLAELNTFLKDPSSIWSALGSAIPAASNFFINYVCYRALVMSAFRLFYPHQAILSSIVKWLHILPKAKTPRDKLLEVPPRNCRYGRDIGIPVLMNFVMVCAMCVTSPLILPFGLLYFLGLWAVWRYQALYVYQRQYESGGQFWPLVAHKVVGCQFIMVVFTASVLLFKGGYTQAALLYITLPIYLLKFDSYLRRRYDDLVRQVPLMAVHNAGRSAVPADIYTPPPLRSGGHGWHPEWGKIWQHWGIPRYTI